MAYGWMIPETAHLSSRARRETAGWRRLTATGIDQLAHTQWMVWDGMIDVTDAMKVFSQSRLQAHLNTCKLLVSCYHPMELVALHQKHVQDAMAQYQDHAQEVSERLWQCILNMPPARDDAEAS